jgi:hypothetical protein
MNKASLLPRGFDTGLEAAPVDGSQPPPGRLLCGKRSNPVVAAPADRDCLVAALLALPEREVR